ncbi:hypothetical protein QO009_003034 [Brevibacillus aydinogluensis]|nr:hypothetical protein [Brevibacillus aydinogluensis]
MNKPQNDAKHKFLSILIQKGGYSAIVASLILGAEVTNQQYTLKRYTHKELRNIAV